jgi:hypothetical protein
MTSKNILPSIIKGSATNAADRSVTLSALSTGFEISAGDDK